MRVCNVLRYKPVWTEVWGVERDLAMAGQGDGFGNADEIAAATGLQGIGYNEPAARRSWALMQQFFAEIFGTK